MEVPAPHPGGVHGFFASYFTGPTAGSLIDMNPSPLAISPELVALLKRHNMLRNLLRHQLVDDCVQHVTVSSKEREQLLQRYRQSNGLDADAPLEEHLQSRGLSEADLYWQLELPIRRNRFALERFKPKAEQRFLERKNNLDRVVYSLLRLKNPHLANELYLQIAEGESTFTELAAMHSEGNEKQTKGIVGPTPLNQAHPILVEKLRSTAPGQLMEPFRIQDWTLIARLERYLPAQFDQAMEVQMCNELFEKWINEELPPMVARIMSSVSTDPAA